MPHDVKFVDRDGKVRQICGKSVTDSFNHIAVHRSWNTVVDPGSSTTFIPKDRVIEVRTRPAAMIDDPGAVDPAPDMFTWGIGLIKGALGKK